MAAFAAKAGRQLTPYLKVLVGPWWLLSFDLDDKEASQRRLPGLKQQEVLLFCRDEVCSVAPPLGMPRHSTFESAYAFWHHRTR